LLAPRPNLVNFFPLLCQLKNVAEELPLVEVFGDSPAHFVGVGNPSEEGFEWLRHATLHNKP
jgi:hypothetical protein